MRAILSLLTIMSILISCNSKQEARDSINNKIEIEINHDMDYIGYLVFSSDFGDKLWWGDWNPWIEIERSDIDTKLSSIIEKAIEDGEIDTVGLYSAGIVISDMNYTEANTSFFNVGFDSSIKLFLKKLPIEEFRKAKNEFYKNEKVIKIIQEQNELKTYLKQSLKLSEKIDFLEDYFGLEFKKYKIIPSLTFIPYSGSGPLVQSGDNLIPYYIYGPSIFPSADQEDISYNSLGFFSCDLVETIAVHEFCHSFYSIIYNNNYKEQIMNASFLYTKEVENLTEKRGYGRNNWLGIFEEHFVRAIELLYLDETGKKEEFKIQIQREKENGFLYIDSFYKCVKELRHDNKINVLNYILNMLT